MRGVGRCVGRDEVPVAVPNRQRNRAVAGGKEGDGIADLISVGVPQTGVNLAIEQHGVADRHHAKRSSVGGGVDHQCRLPHLDEHPGDGWRNPLKPPLPLQSPRAAVPVSYTHLYFKKPEAKSAFDRYSRQRSDTFSAEPGYWPTIFHAPRQNVKAHGLAKNQAVITDILGSFTVRSVLSLIHI